MRVKSHSRTKTPLLLVAVGSTAHAFEVLSSESNSLSHIIDKERNDAFISIQEHAHCVARGKMAPIFPWLASCAHHLLSATLVPKSESCCTTGRLAAEEYAAGTA